jgi:PKD repeat protein
MKKILLSFLFFTGINLLSAQEPLHCGADEMRIATLKANPKIAEAVIKRDSALESFTKKYVADFYQKRTPAATYIIPVVVHVIHNYGAENISTAQILDGISILNKTFRKQAADTGSIVAVFKPIHADTDIEFRLATIDPDGNCTSGINRIASSLTSVGDHSVKSLIQWPTDKYLNVYVVQNAAGLAGHCVWPADADSIPAWDGIVISHNYVGSIGTSNLTQSVAFAHECGHYLNLQHIWGGNNVPGFYFYPCADTAKDCSIDDLVADTPPTIGWQTCNLSGFSCGNTVDNVQNAMDYSYCNKMFTYGQKARMHACLNDTIAKRNNLWQVSNLIATGTYALPGALCKADFSSNKTVVCETGSNQITFTNTSFNGAVSSQVWTFPGGSPSMSTASSPLVTYSSPGSYPVSLKVFSGTDSAMITKTNYVSVLPNTGAAYPFSEGFETISTLTGPEWYSNSYDTTNQWELTTAAASGGTHAVMLDNYNNAMNTKDELYSPVVNLSGGTGMLIRFKYAYARKDTLSQDFLQLSITKDCNSSWIQRLGLIGPALETVAPVTAPYVPAAGDWRQMSVTIPAFYLTANFRFRFAFTSKGGNNLYIDDINIDMASGIENIAEQLSALEIYPNPANDVLNLSFDLSSPASLSFRICNVLGQEFYNSGKSFYTQGNNRFVINVNNLENGFYFIKINKGKEEIVKKFVVNR